MGKFDNITADSLSGEQKALAEVIGIDAYIKLVMVYGGCNIYIAKVDKLQNIKRDEEICKRFNGSNYSQLAREYDLAVRTVYEIVSKKLAKQQQLSLFQNNEETAQLLL